MVQQTEYDKEGIKVLLLCYGMVAVNKISMRRIVGRGVWLVSLTEIIVLSICFTLQRSNSELNIVLHTLTNT